MNSDTATLGSECGRDEDDGDDSERRRSGRKEGGNIGMAEANATEADEEVARIGSSTKMFRPRPKYHPS